MFFCIYLYMCVFLCWQPENTAEFMNAATKGKLNVVDKYLADGGNPNVHDEVFSLFLKGKQKH